MPTPRRPPVFSARGPPATAKTRRTAGRDAPLFPTGPRFCVQVPPPGHHHSGRHRPPDRPGLYASGLAAPPCFRHCAACRGYPDDVQTAPSTPCAALARASQALTAEPAIWQLISPPSDHPRPRSVCRALASGTGQRRALLSTAAKTPTAWTSSVLRALCVHPYRSFPLRQDLRGGSTAGRPPRQTPPSTHRPDPPCAHRTSTTSTPAHPRLTRRYTIPASSQSLPISHYPESRPLNSRTLANIGASPDPQLARVTGREREFSALTVHMRSTVALSSR